jgi:hypothetical protein
MLCPFSTRICSECPYYRGRHYYMSLCENYRGYIKGSKNGKKSGNHRKLPDFKTFGKLVEPWSHSKASGTDDGLEMTLDFVDMETSESKKCDYREVKDLDWDNTSTLRMLDGRHVTSWEQLLEMLHYKQKKGQKEAKIYEGPRFILLGGG